MAAFGANEWLVDEMYERYQQDPKSVDPAWLSFFKNHSPEAQSPNGGSEPASTPSTAPAPTAPPAPAASPTPSTAPNGAALASPPTPTKTSPATDVQPRPDAPRVAPTRTPKEPPPPVLGEASDAPAQTVLRGAPARTVQNMDASLTVPTATSVRSVPVKLLIDNRIVINNHLSRARGGKVSFTHVIGYALVKAVKAMPEMNVGFDVVDGKPTLITPAHINLGLAIDMAKPDGTRQLLVPSIKAAEGMDFAGFWTAYEDIVRKARGNNLAVTDFQGTTITLTNPGTIGTNHSVPRLMKGQGAIIGVGSMDYPPEYEGASDDTLNRNAVSKVMTLTSTYDHRVIQGAQSGEFLKRIHALLLGEDGFYDEIFRALRIP
jgi:2-oxoglutarate decarboxylase